jgi:hypothetical protein
MKAKKIEGTINLKTWYVPDYDQKFEDYTNDIDKVVQVLEQRLEAYRSVMIDACQKNVERVIKDEIKKSGIVVEMPEPGEREKKTPLDSIRIRLPFGAAEFEDIVFEFSFGELVEDSFGYIYLRKPKDAIETYKKTRDAFQAGVDRMTEVINQMKIEEDSDDDAHRSDTASS